MRRRELQRLGACMAARIDAHTQGCVWMHAWMHTWMHTWMHPCADVRDCTMVYRAGLGQIMQAHVHASAHVDIPGRAGQAQSSEGHGRARRMHSHTRTRARAHMASAGHSGEHHITLALHLLCLHGHIHASMRCVVVRCDALALRCVALRWVGPGRGAAGCGL